MGFFDIDEDDQDRLIRDAEEESQMDFAFDEHEEMRIQAEREAALCPIRSWDYPAAEEEEEEEEVVLPRKRAMSLPQKPISRPPPPPPRQNARQQNAQQNRGRDAQQDAPMSQEQKQVPRNRVPVGKPEKPLVRAPSFSQLTRLSRLSAAMPEEEEEEEEVEGNVLPRIMSTIFRPLPENVLTQVFAGNKESRMKEIITKYKLSVAEGQALVGSLTSQVAIINQDPEKLAVRVRELYNACGGDCNPKNDIDVLQLVHMIYTNYGDYPIQVILLYCKIMYFYCGSLISSLRQLSLARHPDLKAFGEDMMRTHLIRSRERLSGMEYVIVGMSRIRCSCNPTFDAQHIAQTGVLFDPQCDQKKFDKFQRALIYILGRFELVRARRYQNSIYYPRLTPSGDFAHSYVYRGTVAEMVGMEIGSAITGSAFQIIVTGKGFRQGILQYLADTAPPELPLLMVDRHVFAFNNGVYNAANNRFSPHNAALDDLTAVTYFNEDFNDYPEHDGPFFPNDVWPNNDDELEVSDDDPMNIPTPAFDSLFTYQWPESKEEQRALPAALRVLDPKILRRFTYAMFIRLLFEVGEDNFQKIMVLIGVGGAGKSILADIIRKCIYPGADQTATIGPENEVGFGLQTVYNKLAFIISEMRPNTQGKFGLPETDFLSMVVGETIGVRRKYGDMLNVVWNVPGLIVGNSFCNYSAGRDSLARRLYLVNFDRPVSADIKDETLQQRVFAETPRIILKCARLYLGLRRGPGGVPFSNIDLALPRQVKLNINILMRSADEILAFFRASDNGLLRDEAGGDASPLYCPLDDIDHRFHAWRKSRGLKTSTAVFTPQQWNPTLAMYGCKLAPEDAAVGTVSMVYPRSGNTNKDALYVIGVDIIDRCSEVERVEFGSGKQRREEEEEKVKEKAPRKQARDRRKKADSNGYSPLFNNEEITVEMLMNMYNQIKVDSARGLNCDDIVNALINKATSLLGFLNHIRSEPNAPVDIASQIATIGFLNRQVKAQFF